MDIKLQVALRNYKYEPTVGNAIILANLVSRSTPISNKNKDLVYDCDSDSSDPYDGEHLTYRQLLKTLLELSENQLNAKVSVPDHRESS